jgi:putative DNA primase/helicase
LNAPSLSARIRRERSWQQNNGWRALPETSDLESYAEALGGEVDGDFILCPSPGRPADDRSCWVRIGRGQPYIYDCEGPSGAAYRYVRERLQLAPPKPSADHSGFALEILSETSAATGTLVETYLRGRALTLPVPPCLHFHPSLKHTDIGHWPAMVAERANVEGRVVAIHRTYLAHGGKKAHVDPVRMDLGPAAGTAIRLSPVADELMVGEGIETTLSAIAMTGRPGWAAGSAVMMRKVQLPAIVKLVTILADGDEPGENAARDSARRWLREGRRVKIARAPRGKDFNDVLKERVSA